MTASGTSTPVILEPEADDAWRGVAAEDSDDISGQRRRQAAGAVPAAAPVADPTASLVGPACRDGGGAQRVGLSGRAVGGGLRHRHRGARADAPGDAGPLVYATLAYLAAGIANAAGKALFVRLSARVSQAVLLDLRGRVFDHAQALSLSFHERYTSGRVISRMTSDLDTLGDLAQEGLEGLISGLLSVVAISVTLLLLDVAARADRAARRSSRSLLATRWFQHRSRRIYRRTRSAIASVIVQFTETMNGLRAVLSFRREEPQPDHLRRLQRGERQGERRRAGGAGASTRRLVRLFGNLSLVATMVRRRRPGDRRNAGARGARRLPAVRAADVRPAGRAGDVLQLLPVGGRGAGEDLRGLLEETPAGAGTGGPGRAERRRADRRRRPVRGGVGSPTHPAVPVLPELDLHIPAGQTVAVVGATGAGKSTLAKLLARFYDPTAGRVLLDGVDVATGRHAGPAPRRGDGDPGVVPVLRLGRRQHRARPAGGDPGGDRGGRGRDRRRRVHPVAAEGFDTDVRKRGGRLSAGQRQLVAFARAFLADPAVLILDEATASLDIPAERAVQRALRTVLAGRTAVIIAHRLSTVAIADRVLVMEHGRIVEDGAPDDLIGRRRRLRDAARRLAGLAGLSAGPRWSMSWGKAPGSRGLPWSRPLWERPVRVPVAATSAPRRSSRRRCRRPLRPRSSATPAVPGTARSPAPARRPPAG